MVRQRKPVGKSKVGFSYGSAIRGDRFDKVIGPRLLMFLVNEPRALIALRVERIAEVRYRRFKASGRLQNRSALARMTAACFQQSSGHAENFVARFLA